MRPFDEVEAIWREARNAYAAAEVVRSSGGPVEGIDDPLERLERRFDDAHDRLIAALDGVSPGSLDEEERRGVDAIRDALDWMVGDRAFVASVEPVDALAGTSGAATPDAPGLDPFELASRPTGYADLRRWITERYATATTAIRAGAETIDRLTAFARLATLEDAEGRRDLFMALEPVYRAVDGDGGDRSPFRALLALSAARWARDGSPIEASAARLGLVPGEFEAWLRRILDAWRAAAVEPPVEPWDLRFASGVVDRQFSSRLTIEGMRAVNARHLAALGADPDRLGIVYDVVPRPGRPVIPVAFTTVGAIGQDVGGTWRPARPWVFATYATASRGNLHELLHESGHAIHYAAVRTRPAFFDWADADAAFVEGIADVVGWDADEPAWQAAHLGDSARASDALRGRYGGVMLDICWALLESELHRSPDRRPNDVWTELTTRYLGVVPHPELSWWAVRGQLFDSPGYMASYAAAAIIAADLRARIRDLRGEWYLGDPGWFDFVADRLLRFGATRSPAEILGEFLGRRLAPDALIADLGRLRGA